MGKIGVIDIVTSEIIYWSSVTLACLLGAMSPGPSVAVVINYAMSGNKWVGIYCAWGHGIAIALYAFISAFGLLIVFEKSLLYSIFFSWQVLQCSHIRYQAIQRPNTTDLNI